MGNREFLKHDRVIRGIAEDFIRDYDLDNENVDIFLEDTNIIDEISAEVDNNRALLMNYDDYRQDYIDSVIDTIDYLVRKD